LSNERPASSLPARFKWVLGVPYFVQGSSNFVEVPTLYFIKNVLAMGDAGGQLFDSLRSAGWLVKPLWGYVSDRVTLFGYRRKSWFVLMALAALAFWAIAALMFALGLRVPWLYLAIFNLAFTTYAFVDVVCDAVMVEQGRRFGRVGAFVNLQWTVLALANAIALAAGGWFQSRIQAGDLSYALLFLLTGLPPLATAWVGARYIPEQPVARREHRRAARRRFRALATAVAALPRKLAGLRHGNRTLWLLVLFIFFWKFSPSVGFIERSYLIDERGFAPGSFGTILSVSAVTFFVSLLVYRSIVHRYPGVEWYQYLYAMIGLGVVSFPLSFYLYLDPGHAWWDLFVWMSNLPEALNPLPGWNRYEWFRLLTGVVLGFATIPAFVIPLTLAGETVKLEYAGVSYAFLMAFSNVTDTFEGVIGAGLYKLFSHPGLEGLLGAFEASWLNVAGTSDERTLILQIFVYVSLVFTLLTLPFLWLLRSELDRRGIVIRLGEAPGCDQHRG